MINKNALRSKVNAFFAVLNSTVSAQYAYVNTIITEAISEITPEEAEKLRSELDEIGYHLGQAWSHLGEMAPVARSIVDRLDDNYMVERQLENLEDRATEMEDFLGSTLQIVSSGDLEETFPRATASFGGSSSSSAVEDAAEDLAEEMQGGDGIPEEKIHKVEDEDTRYR